MGGGGGGRFKKKMLAAYYFHSSLGGGNIRIETKKVKVEAKSKVGSLNNTTHKPGGGDKKVRLELLSFFPQVVVLERAY